MTKTNQIIMASKKTAKAMFDKIMELDREGEDIINISKKLKEGNVETFENLDLNIIYVIIEKIKNEEDKWMFISLILMPVVCGLMGFIIIIINKFLNS